jgi:hypothetical protein
LIERDDRLEAGESSRERRRMTSMNPANGESLDGGALLQR